MSRSAPTLLEARRRAAATLLAAHRDVLDGRPDAGEPPAALAERGWAEYLLACDDAAVELLEARGVDAPWPAGAPASLLDLAEAVRETCTLPAVEGSATTMRAARRAESPRKHAQVEAFARVVVPIAAKAKRVVDVGSGHGHLTRELAEQLGIPVLGLEREAALAGRARSLARDRASFDVKDVLAGGLSFSTDDCAVGLHACGELGDAMVVSAAHAGASLALVGCCLQKRRSASRAPLCGDDAALDLPRSILGLSNLTAREDGVEASRAENLRARERRLALHRLLVDAGLDLRLGAELEGLNRRSAHAELDMLAARAFALRRLPPPSRTAITDSARWAHVHHARMRRLALPRSLLGRLLEVFVLLDRACHLEARGYEVTVGVLFPTAVSARNLYLVGARS